jgi:uncharacterized protein YdhG (YjbR/CyaY superfamily)
MSAKEVTAHLKKFDLPQRKILQTLREQILALIPGAQEVIKYGIPTLVVEGVPLIGFDGFKKHNSIFPYSGSFNQRLEVELSKFKQTKGSIHFDMEKPFPKALLKKILIERIAQINGSYPKRNGEVLEFYPNGVLKAKGKYRGLQLHGDWVWYRKTGVIMRSGTFKYGVQIGKWTTYDTQGKIYKVSSFD